MKRMRIHPECARWPKHGENDPEEWKAFVDGIKANPNTTLVVWTYKDCIVDGRSRYEAALECKAKVEFREWKPSREGLTEEEINTELYRWICAVNHNHRGNDAGVAAMIGTMWVIENQKGEKSISSLIDIEAKAIGVSASYMKKAAVVLKADNKNNTTLADDVIRGRKTLSEAYTETLGQWRDEEETPEPEPAPPPLPPPIKVKIEPEPIEEQNPEFVADIPVDVRTRDELTRAFDIFGESIKGIVRMVSRAKTQSEAMKAVIGEKAIMRLLDAYNSDLPRLADLYQRARTDSGV